MRQLCFVLILTTGLAAGCGNLINGPAHSMGHDLLVNGAFTPNASLIAVPDAPNLTDTTMAPPWNVATGSPQLCTWKGHDSLPGYIMMWGSADHGEGILQMLRTPIRKGRQYRVELDAIWLPQDPLNNIHHVIVRFVAFNQNPGSDGFFWGHWQEDRPRVTVIGSITTADSTWKHYSAPVWTADADYAGFAMNSENEVRQNDTPYNHSWAACDNVKLIELGSDQ